MNTLERMYKNHLKGKWGYEGPVDLNVLAVDKIKSAVDVIKGPLDSLANTRGPTPESIKIVQVQYDICVGAVEDLLGIIECQDLAMHVAAPDRSTAEGRILHAWEQRLLHYGARLEASRETHPLMDTPSQKIRYLADVIGLHRPYLARMGWRPDVQWDSIAGGVYHSGVWIYEKLKSIDKRMHAI